MNINRQPAGQPTGGQFAEGARAAASVALEDTRDTGFDANGLTGEDKELWDIISAEDWGDEDSPGGSYFPSLYNSHNNEHLFDVARVMSANPRFEGLGLRDLDSGDQTIVLTTTNAHNPGVHMTKSLDIRAMMSGDGDIGGEAGAMLFAKNLAREYDDLKQRARPDTTQDIMSQAQVLNMMGRELKVEYTPDGGETTRLGTVRAGLFDAGGIPVSSPTPKEAYVRVTTDEGTEEYHRFTDMADWVSEGAIAER